MKQNLGSQKWKKIIKYLGTLDIEIGCDQGKSNIHETNIRQYVFDQQKISILNHFIPIQPILTFWMDALSKMTGDFKILHVAKALALIYLY